MKGEWMWKECFYFYGSVCGVTCSRAQIFLLPSSRRLWGGDALTERQEAVRRRVTTIAVCLLYAVAGNHSATAPFPAAHDIGSGRDQSGGTFVYRLPVMQACTRFHLWESLLLSPIADCLLICYGHKYCSLQKTHVQRLTHVFREKWFRSVHVAKWCNNIRFVNSSGLTHDWTFFMF